MDFKDYFSKQAKEYSKYRPKYPPELFEYLSTLPKEHKKAWDAATGNGQAAVGLAPYFDEIIATDASASQIEHAEPHPKIIYRTATAENSGIISGSCDMVSIATAIHWLDTDKFYAEVRRVLKPGGIIAVWTYAESRVNDEIDKVYQPFSKHTLGSYWPKENRKAWEFERLIDFPFVRIKTPVFSLTLQWSLKDYINYIYTWSAVHNYIKANGKNPIELVYEDFKKVWGDEDMKRDIIFPIEMKVGRV
jgi:ubiquinone/menaquinone biosynthesis C-methylase UbiE